MALDISILGSDGAVLDSVAVGESAHFELMSAAVAVGCAALLRLRDYYGEVQVFAHSELQSLLDGLDAIGPRLRSPAREVVEDVRRLVCKAMLQNHDVCAMPD